MTRAAEAKTDYAFKFSLARMRNKNLALLAIYTRFSYIRNALEGQQKKPAIANTEISYQAHQNHKPLAAKDFKTK